MGERRVLSEEKRNLIMQRDEARTAGIELITRVAAAKRENDDLQREMRILEARKGEVKETMEDLESNEGFRK